MDRKKTRVVFSTCNKNCEHHYQTGCDRFCMNRNWCGEVKGGWKDRKGEGRGRDSEIVLEREEKR